MRRKLMLFSLGIWSLGIGICGGEAAAPDGARVVRDLRCMACHDLADAVEGVPPVAKDLRALPEKDVEAYRAALEDGRIAPSLTRAGERLRSAWVFRYLQQPYSIRRHLKMIMPGFELAPREALAVTLYLETLRGDVKADAPTSPPDPAVLARGKVAWDHMQCATCHDEKPTGRYPGPLPAAFARLRPAWVAPWIRSPGAQLPEATIMADADLSEEDTAALAAYARSLAPAEAVAAEDAALAAAHREFPDAGADDGRDLVTHLNCAGCHALPGDIKPRGTFAPKLVSGAGRLILPDDVRDFLLKPVKVNHDDPGRMPDFRLSREQAAAAAAYLASLEQINLGSGAAAGFRIDRLPLPPPRRTWFTGLAVDAKGVPYMCCCERGEVYRLVDRDRDGVEETLQVFADGLDVPLGLAFDRGGSLLVAQRAEVTRLRDTDGDGRADAFETVMDDWTIHLWEKWTHTIFGFGPVVGPDGTIYCASPTSRYFPDQGLSTGGGLRGVVLARRPDGTKEIFARGFKVPYGLTVDDDNRLFAHDNDHGFGHGGHYDEIHLVRRDSYHRHGRPDWDRTPYPEGDDAIMHFLPPYGSTATGIAACPKATGHPFAGQIFVTRNAGKMVCRVERVPAANGVLNAVAYPFCSAEQPTSLAFGPDGTLWIGGGTGLAYKVRRVAPDGQELREIRMPDATHLRLVAAQPLTSAERDRVVRTNLYRIERGHEEGGGPLGLVVKGWIEVKSARVLDDGRTVELETEPMKPKSTQALHVTGWPGPFPKAVYVIEINGGW